MPDMFLLSHSPPCRILESQIRLGLSVQHRPAMRVYGGHGIAATDLEFQGCKVEIDYPGRHAMTRAESAFLARVHRRTAMLTAEMAATILRAYHAIADALPESEITRLIVSGAFDAFVSSVLTDA